MSKRAALSSAVLVVAALALGLGYYFGRDEPPASAAPAPATAEPTPPPKTVPQLLDEVQTQRAEPSAPDRVKERSVSMPADTVVAVIGDEQIPLRIQVVPRGARSAEELAAIEKIDDGRSSGFFEPLAAAARAANDEAARVLHEALGACRSEPTTRAKFDAALDKLRKGYAQAGGIAAPGEKPADFDFLARELENSYRRCEGVTDAMYQTSVGLLRESVERSDEPPAHNRLLYAEAVRKTDPEAARAQYEILWQQGYLLALGGIPDLPHQIAWVAANIAYLHAPPETMTAFEASTSPSAFNDASKEAARILKNPNCCKL